MKYRFGVIGLGRVGGAMLALLRDAGHIPVWVVSSKARNPISPVHSDIPDSPGDVQVVFIAVPDGHIRRIAERIQSLWGQSCRGIVFFHFSGLLTSDELAALSHEGAATGSLHPLQSITDADRARQILKGSIFTFEGSQEAIEAARDIVGTIGAFMLSISREHKVLYHASAVVASNYLVTLLSQASEIMASIGMDLKHLMPLIKGTLSNIEEHGSKALTGPIARGDWETVQAHVNALVTTFPDMLQSYLALARYTARIAGQRFPEEMFGGSKLKDADDLLYLLKPKRQRGMKVVFTNGCFDIIHAGHVIYLNKARALGDCLVVGLNSDASVKMIKGKDRPVNNQTARAVVLGALECVDHVVLFEEDTPLKLIERVKPDVLVKGGDWHVDDIVGSGIVKSSGGRVLTIPFEDGFSTTSIIEKIRQD
ncbi:MAG TPA: D-glycero-beta-D-manno-heptose 1-phosphate adenylyltransferase [Desulfomonilia bacterium]|nr:D-glycero-beta-D-manno-heptose 1-phosphate adenylyltransferase [Desulfomonilia bacterium]